MLIDGPHEADETDSCASWCSCATQHDEISKVRPSRARDGFHERKTPSRRCAEKYKIHKPFVAHQSEAQRRRKCGERLKHHHGTSAADERAGGNSGGSAHDRTQAHPGVTFKTALKQLPPLVQCTRNITPASPPAVTRRVAAATRHPTSVCRTRIPRCQRRDAARSGQRSVDGHVAIACVVDIDRRGGSWVEALYGNGSVKEQAGATPGHWEWHNVSARRRSACGATVLLFWCRVLAQRWHYAPPYVVNLVRK
ncbi:hypothetical protein BC628DRAFT_544687 [Trametes gibbosa]|nr:hypothetical protein BC628DRAFT_544687 [Trametes gibbosa]